MSTVRHHTTASPTDVWRVLSDGWGYASWVVGASRIRDVSTEWPQQGALLHHSVGLWPLLIDDETEVITVESERLLTLEARTRPAGEAQLEFRLEPDERGTMVTMDEWYTTGPVSLIPQALAQAWLDARNRECLLRLALIAESAIPLGRQTGRGREARR